MSVLVNEAPLLLVVDDDPAILALVGRWLSAAGMKFEALTSGEACLAALSRTLPDAVLLDIDLPGANGIDVLQRIKAHHPRLPVVMMTAAHEVATVVDAMQAGAHDYIPKPIDRTKLEATVRNAVEHARMTLRLQQLERDAAGAGVANMVGDSPVMREMFGRIDRVASSDVTVLIHGESGTGKELVARGIHDGSTRRDGPFVAMNCAAIADTLQEDELFGHEKGAFTGADSLRPGRFEQADGGTLFLDEVAELSLGVQAKLLRVVQERSLYRLGGSEAIRPDFRIVAASHKQLAEEVAAGRFREDLYYRLAVFELEVPSLRERGEDVIALAQLFLRKHGQGAQSKTFSPAALMALMAYSWPGNVRELENAVQRCLIESTTDTIGVEHLDRISTGRAALDARQTPGVKLAPAASLEDLEREAIMAALGAAGGNVSSAAKQLGIGRTTMYRKLAKYGIS